MMKRIAYIFLSAALTASGFASSGVSANEPASLTVLELFTSQGCSSCPPADALLKTLRHRDGVLALSWSVDYWDRMGWEDTMAMPHNTVRQTAYNKRFGLSGVYTPQIVIDGRFETIGSFRKKIEDAIGDARQKRATYTVIPVLEKSGNTLKISLPEKNLPAVDTHDGMSRESVAVRLVYFREDVNVAIGDGENEGRELHYSNVVRHTSILGEWVGDAATFTADLSEAIELEADNVAVLLQLGYRHGPIVGAGHMKLAKLPAMVSGMNASR